MFFDNLQFKKGINLAEPNICLEGVGHESKVCIFLSHISIDKSTALAIGEYIKTAGFNIYLDIYDDKLQQALEDENSVEVTQCIEKGIDIATHMICLVSDETKQSWWVPYEIGYGKRKGIDISTLFLKNVGYIPDFLKITKKIEDKEFLTKYLINLKKNNEDTGLKYITEQDYSQEYLTKASAYKHPLENYLK